MTSVTGYDDGKIALTDTELIIRRYYFPAGDKRIPYSSITEVRRVPMGPMGKYRIWGSSDFVHWFNLDAGRPRKDTALVVRLDARIRPVITPDSPDQVVAELTAHGVVISTASEPGLI